MIKIPFNPIDPNQYFTISLSGKEYVLFFKYNPRVENTGGDSGAWYMDIMFDIETPIARGVKIVPDYPLNLSDVNPFLPDQIFAVFNEHGGDESIGRRDLGIRSIIIYDPLDNEE